jgi:hypothetical protein
MVILLGARERERRFFARYWWTRTETVSHVLNLIQHVCYDYNIAFHVAHSCAGQGSKVCLYGDKNKVSIPHTTASHDVLQMRLQLDHDIQLDGASPSRDMFQKTSALIIALRRLGCNAPLSDVTECLPHERDTREKSHAHFTKLQRGYQSSRVLCKGRILFDTDHQGRVFIRSVVLIFVIS